MPAAARAFLSFLVACAAHAQCPKLTSPPDDAHPHSAYIAIEGITGPASVLSLFDGQTPIEISVSSDGGRFGRVLHLSSGRHELRLEKTGCAPVKFAATIADFPAPPSNSPFEHMRPADIVLAHTRNSRQDAIYKPTYTHSALYIGAGSDGAALVLEAVNEHEAGADGPVAAVPIEQTLAFRYGDRIDLFRPKDELGAADRERILAWSRRTAAKGLPFLADEAFGDAYRIWLLWDQAADKPRDAAEVASIAQTMRQRLESTNAFDCATLIWHAYRDNTAAHIDLAHPSRAEWGGLARTLPPHLVKTLEPLLIAPDSFAASEKLVEVRPR